MAAALKQIALAVGLFAAVSPAGAQKKVAVRVTHPAGFGAVLLGKKVILGPGTGECAQEFLELLKPDLAAHRVLVVPETEADGPAVRLTVAVARCDTRRREPMVGSGLPAAHISRVEGRFQAQIRATDIASGKELASDTVRAEAHKENRSETSPPEYPAQSEVRELLLAKALAAAQRLYVPWMESQELPFFDDQECGLRQAFELVKAADYDGALKAARGSAGSCQAAAKLTAGAWYNYGVVLMLKRSYDDALAAFNEAQQRYSRKFVPEIAAGCQKDKALVDAEKAVRASAAAAPAGTGQTGILLTNEFVLKMVRANVAEEEIVKMIAAQPCRFELGPDDLRKLREAGTPEAVISAMAGKR